MKKEYDFTGAERGKFYRKDATLVPPIHLEADILSYFLDRARARGASLSDLVNQVLRKDIELIEAGR
jgi:hypothetical protein